jgi:signal transduction histidine kinase
MRCGRGIAGCPSRCASPRGGRAAAGDGGRILQMLHHLLGNALKFTRQGTVSLQLSAPRRDWLRFTVADTGRG